MLNGIHLGAAKAIKQERGLTALGTDPEYFAEDRASARLP